MLQGVFMPARRWVGRKSAMGVGILQAFFATKVKKVAPEITSTPLTSRLSSESGSHPSALSSSAIDEILKNLKPAASLPKANDFLCRVAHTPAVTGISEYAEPQDDTVPWKNVWEMLKFQSDNYEFNDFFRYDRRQVNLTSREFFRHSAALAIGLERFDVKQGENILVWMCQNSPEYANLQMAAAITGAGLVAVDGNCSKDDLHRAIRETKPRIIVFWPEDERTPEKPLDKVDMLYDLLPELVRENVNHVSNFITPPLAVKRYPGLRAIFMAGIEFLRPEGFHEYLDLLLFKPPPNAVDSHHPEALCNAVGHSDTGLISFTRGIAGRPNKSVASSQGALLFNAYELGKRMQLSRGERIIVASDWSQPMTHLAHLACAMNGVVCHSVSSFYDPTKVLNIIENEKCAGIVANSSFFDGLLRSSSLSKHNLSSLRTGLVGPCSSDLTEQLVGKLGMKDMLHLYGTCETTGAISTSLPSDSVELRCGSLGVPLPNVEVRVASPCGKAVAVDVEGELLVRGPNVMQGYVNPDVPSAFTDDGWLCVGDRVTMNKSGRLFFKGHSENSWAVGDEQANRSNPQYFDQLVVDFSAELQRMHVKA